NLWLSVKRGTRVSLNGKSQGPLAQPVIDAVRLAPTEGAFAILLAAGRPAPGVSVKSLTLSRGVVVSADVEVRGGDLSEVAERLQVEPAKVKERLETLIANTGVSMREELEGLEEEEGGFSQAKLYGLK